MAKGHAKAEVVRVRVNPELFKRVSQAAKASKQTVSEWLRATASAAVNYSQEPRNAS
jgi:predicted HicB family RNase H-like nuclease